MSNMNNNNNNNAINSNKMNEDRHSSASTDVVVVPIRIGVPQVNHHNHHNNHYHQKSLTPSIKNQQQHDSTNSSIHGSVRIMENNSISSASTTTITVSQQQQQSANKTTTTTATTNLNNNKKHNIGFRLRRLFFGSTSPNNPSITPKSSGKNSTKDVIEASENKNFIKHNPSLHSSSSESSTEHHKSDSKRKRNLSTMLQQNRKSTTDNSPSVSASLSASNNSRNFYNSMECSICLLEQPIFQFPELKTCSHRACISCLRQYLRIEIYESRINITCLQCQELMHPNDIKSILKNDTVLIEKYESFMVRRTLITDPDARWCPAPDCGYCVIATGCASCPMLRCERPGCETLFCYHCKQEWHPNQTCDQARAQRGLNKSVFIQSPNPTKSNVTFTSRGTDSFNQAHASTSVDSFVQRDDIKPCPCCKVLIIKMNDGSCNHMTCSVCGTEFCWLCMQKISDLHYLSPSGCTFWGKKPWSRKKKIMWQLGMLVGAPVGIALIAGIAVPAIIIGIPVWVGRKLYSRFERNHMSRHKSNFLVTTGVLTSIFVSPILAAVAVGIGVPILLAYVYGVVPISLCRSGGCGVTTSSSGVRIELDEDEITFPDGVSVDTALSGRGVTNPSIGEVSLGMSASLSIGSSSHLDRVVLDIQPDRESSSIAACAGSITSNYINNGGQAQAQIIGQKLETLADINSHKRFSLSSQNADSSSVTLSFGERSVNTNASMIDEAASLKAQTGSLLETSIGISNNNNNNNNQQQQQVSLSPVEVHVINEPSGSTTNKHRQTKQQQQHSKCQKGNDQVPKSNFLLNKFESRSMEYLSNNYCNICHKSHKPCCPNFQHPNSTKSIKIAHQAQIIQSQNEQRKKSFTSSTSTNDDPSVKQSKSSNDSSTNNRQILKQSKKFNQLPHISFNNNNNNNNRIQNAPTLSKKAMSQIFYPSMYSSKSETFNNNNNNNNSNNNNNNNETNTKSNHHGLSHSLSFTSPTSMFYDSYYV